jgi:transcriptional regulator with XRE-family HTH domain
MDESQAVLAANLKRLREERRLSLDMTAEATGVSKSMLGQIERGESSPTIQTVWKIANGLRVSLSRLVDPPEPAASVVSMADIDPIRGDEGRFRVYSLFPYREDTRFEIIAVELDGGAFSSSEPHAPGTVEYLLVVAGRIEIEAGGERKVLGAGESMKYRADLPHSYRNAGKARCAFRMVMFYPGR